MTDAVGDLHVDAARMRERIDATGGSIFAEQAMMLLAPAIGRDAAVAAIGAALETSRTTETGLVEALLANAALRDALTPEQRQALGSPEDYLGSAERFRRSLLDPSQPSSRR
jgi:3-carboxy-cis,cis-muconate cycloisomerase